MQKPKHKLAQSIRTADIKGVFSKVDSTNLSCIIYTINETSLIPSLPMESTIYPRDITRIFYDQ